MKNQKIIECLEESGWFAEMPADEVASLRKKLETDPHDEGYLCLATLSFDTETIYSCGPTDSLDSYHDLLNEFAAASWGLFRPKNIRDEYDEAANAIYVGFELQGQRFEAAMPFNSDWVANEFFTLIERSLATCNISQRFIIVPELDQIVNFAFISPTTFDKIEVCGVIPSMDALIEDAGF